MSNEASGSGTASALPWTSGKRHAGLGHQPAGVLELTLGQVEPDRPGAALRQRDRPLRGPAAELEDVLALDVAQDVELGLGDLEVPQAIPPLSASWSPWSAWYSSL